MKNRIIKKHSKSWCSHNHSYRFMVTDDPFPCYVKRFICSLKKINEFEHEMKTFPCDECRKYSISKKRIREENLKSREIKRWIKSGNI